MSVDPTIAALIGTAFGGFLRHIAGIEKRKIGEPATAVGQAGVVVAKAVIPGQVEKADRWLFIHAGPAGPFLAAILGAAETGVESVPSVAGPVASPVAPSPALPGDTSEIGMDVLHPESNPGADTIVVNGKTYTHIPASS